MYQPVDADVFARVVECPAVLTERQEPAFTTGKH